jgi:hypothetical protein
VPLSAALLDDASAPTPFADSDASRTWGSAMRRGFDFEKLSDELR